MRRTGWLMAVSIGVALFLVAPPATGDEAKWKAPAAEKTKKNPLAKAAGEQEGKKAYAANCAVCHGPSGKGDGPGAAALTPRPKNLADKEIQEETDGELFWKITTGRGVMPPWQQLPENVRWSLVHYIRSLAPKK